MRNQLKLEGVLVAIATPLNRDASGVDEDALVQLTKRLVTAEVGGIVTCGSTGEGWSLTPSERRRITELVIEGSDHKLPVIAHTGALTARETIDLSKHAERAGADCLMVVPPFYEPLSWRELVAYYHEIVSAVNIPVMYYHIPMVTGVRLSPAQIAELARTCGMAFVKDSGGDGIALTELIMRYTDSVTVLNGWDSLTFSGFCSGSQGCVWGAATFMPDLCVDLHRAVCRDSDLNRGRELWKKIWPICNFVETEGYVAGVKAACEMLGTPIGPLRLPLLPLEEEPRLRLRQLLAAAGLSVTTAVG